MELEFLGLRSGGKKNSYLKKQFPHFKIEQLFGEL